MRWESVILSQHGLTRNQTPLLTILVLIVTVLMLALHGAERDLKDSILLQFTTIILVITLMITTIRAFQYYPPFYWYVFTAIVISVIVYIIEESVSKPEAQLYNYAWLILRGISWVVRKTTISFLSAILWLVPGGLELISSNLSIFRSQEDMDENLIIMVLTAEISFLFYILTSIFQVISIIVQPDQEISYLQIAFPGVFLLLTIYTMYLVHIQSMHPVIDVEKT